MTKAMTNWRPPRRTSYGALAGAWAPAKGRPRDLQSPRKQERFLMRLFTMKSCQARVLFAQAGAALAVAALLGGCGDNYRPVVTPIGTNGPPAQVGSYALVISSTGSTTAGV